MRFQEYLDDIEENLDIIDGEIDEKTVEDWGKNGKKFETKMVKAIDAAGLDVEVNRYAGKGWDIKPKGAGWIANLTGKDVNIKQAKTKWMFGSTELARMLPWDGFKEGEFDADKAAAKVKKFIQKQGLQKVIYLKPNSPEIQAKINDIANDDKESKAKEKKAKEVLSKKNFYIEKLAPGWSVRVLTRDNRVSSIAIDSEGKVFMRSEKPRLMGGSMTVAFRTPTHVPGKGTQGSVMK